MGKEEGVGKNIWGPERGRAFSTGSRNQGRRPERNGGWNEKKKNLPRNRKLKGIKTARDRAEELDGGLVKGRFSGSRCQVALSQPQGW